MTSLPLFNDVDSLLWRRGGGGGGAEIKAQWEKDSLHTECLSVSAIACSSLW